MRWNVICVVCAFRNDCSALALRRISVYVSVILGHDSVSVKQLSVLTAILFREQRGRRFA